MSKAKNKVFLLSLDGWGLSSSNKGNAINAAKTPVMDKLKTNQNKYAELDASGLHVGLPKGVMGNSEVGHLTMGSGRQKFTDLVRINSSIEDNSFSTNKTLLNAFEYAKTHSKRLHFLGLVSNGGVHSHINHLFELLSLSKKNNVPEAFVHFFSDGRDTFQESGKDFANEVLNYLDQLKYGKLASLVGRYYAMDRDKRWDRFKKAYDMLVKGKGKLIDKSELFKEMEKSYRSKVYDEFMNPMVLLPNNEGCIKNGDTLIFFDFRSDRMRQIVQTFGVKPLFETDIVLKDLHVVQMTEYSSEFNLPILFPPQKMDNVLAEWISKHKMKQFHTAETEKYAHVTFFFNGGREDAFENEDRKLIPSPKVATYDLAPEMSMPQVTQAVIDAMMTGKYDFVMCNFAPPDMVGHTGNYDATLIACEATDKCIGDLIEACSKANYTMLITSDHGNAEAMLDEKGNPKTSHTTNLVPFCLIPTTENNELAFKTNRGSLIDVAPTVLSLLGLDIPKEMAGNSMLVE